MTFDPFGDFETAGYLQNALQLKDSIEVKESEHLAFEASIEDALAFLKNERSIGYAAVLKAKFAIRRPGILTAIYSRLW